MVGLFLTKDTLDYCIAELGRDPKAAPPQYAFCKNLVDSHNTIQKSIADGFAESMMEPVKGK